MMSAIQLTPRGTFFMRINQHIIEITVDGGILISNIEYGTTIAMSACGSMIAIDHPAGRILGDMSKVQIQTPNVKGIRFAKMWKKGISFTTGDRATAFLLDEGGPKTTVDWFTPLNGDLLLQAFNLNSHFGRQVETKIMSLAYNSQYWINTYGRENWLIGNFHISQSSYGKLRINNNLNDTMICMSPLQRSICVKTQLFYCTASSGDNNHLFVRSGDRRLHYDGNIFAVRNGGQSAAIDEINQLKVL